MYKKNNKKFDHYIIVYIVYRYNEIMMLNDILYVILYIEILRFLLLNQGLMISLTQLRKSIYFKTS